MADLHDMLAASHPKLARGVVWCTECGRSRTVNASSCMSSGWPKCCGMTMTIDSPKERGQLRAAISMAVPNG